MKRSILILCAFALSFSTVNAQFWKNETVKGNGEMTTETRNTGDYDEVSLIGSMDVELISGREGELKIEAESNLMEYIITEVKGNTLKITSEDEVSLEPSRNKTIKIIVPVKDLEGVKVTGSGDLWNSNSLKVSNFRTQVTGSGDINLNLDAENVEGNVTGSGDIKIEGKTKNLDCKVTGSGDFDASDFVAENVEATVMGSGDIRVNVTQNLKARVMGSGDIRYRGNPEKEDLSAMGSGEISSE